MRKVVALFVYIMASSLPTSNETGLGEVENEEVCNAICVRTFEKIQRTVGSCQKERLLSR